NRAGTGRAASSFSCFSIAAKRELRSAGASRPPDNAPNSQNSRNTSRPPITPANPALACAHGSASGTNAKGGRRSGGGSSGGGGSAGGGLDRTGSGSAGDCSAPGKTVGLGSNDVGLNGG